MLVVNITDQRIIIVIIEGMEIKIIARVMKGSGAYMTEKRFRMYQDMDDVIYIEDVSFYEGYATSRDYPLCNEEDIRIDNVFRIIELLNKLHEENKELKRELQRMYDVGTLNKAMDVLEKRYDKMLSDGSDEIKDAKRRVVLKCIDDLDEFKDDLTMR